MIIKTVVFKLEFLNKINLFKIKAVLLDEQISCQYDTYQFKGNLKEITVHADSKSLAALEQNYDQIAYSYKKATSSGMDEGWNELCVFLYILNIVNILLYS